MTAEGDRLSESILKQDGLGGKSVLLEYGGRAVKFSNLITREQIANLLRVCVPIDRFKTQFAGWIPNDQHFRPAYECVGALASGITSSVEGLPTLKKSWGYEYWHWLRHYAIKPLYDGHSPIEMGVILDIDKQLAVVGLQCFGEDTHNFSLADGTITVVTGAMAGFRNWFKVATNQNLGVLAGAEIYEATQSGRAEVPLHFDRSATRSRYRLDDLIKIRIQKATSLILRNSKSNSAEVHCCYILTRDEPFGISATFLPGAR